METGKYGSQHHQGLAQLQHNSIAWIGHIESEPAERLAGQTFECPANGRLGHIELYTASVQHEGKIYLSFHPFDKRTLTWGPALGAGEAMVTPEDGERWVRFDLPELPLQKDQVYGFRVQSPGALVAIGETALSNGSYLSSACEWNGNSFGEEGNFYHFFRLAFKVAIRA